MASNRGEANGADQLNRLVEGTIVTGEIIADSNIRIDGQLKGLVQTSGKLVIGPTGVVEGDIICNSADVEGKVKGKLTVSGILVFKSTSNFNGEMTTSKLVVEEGAVLNMNKLDMGGVNNNINEGTSNKEVVKEKHS